jgi:hypothetical protein
VIGFYNIDTIEDEFQVFEMKDDMLLNFEIIY